MHRSRPESAQFDSNRCSSNSTCSITTLIKRSKICKDSRDEFMKINLWPTHCFDWSVTGESHIDETRVNGTKQS